MILLVCFVVAIVLPAVWLFARANPITSRALALKRFNRGSLCAVTVAMVSVIVYFRLTVGEGIDSPWWPYLSIIFGIGLGSLTLLLATAIRFLVFRRDAPSA